MNKRVFASSLPILGYASLVAALFLLLKGYQFNTDDQAEHLPQVYQLLNPALYPNDYYVNAANDVFTVRYYYEQLALVVAKTIGLEWGLFILTFLSCALMAFSFAKIAERLFANQWAVWLAPPFALILFYGFTMSGVSVMYASFISSTIAKGIAAFALWKFFERKVLLTAFLLGVATLFQALVGLQLFLVLAAYYLLIQKNIGHTLRHVIAYTLIASFLLVPVFYIQFTQELSLSVDADWFYHVFYRFRNHMHYYPHLFPIKAYVKCGSLVLAGLAAYVYLRPQDGRFYPFFIFFNVVLLLAYSISLEVFDVYIVAKTQWFKMTIWIQALSAIMLAGCIGQMLSAVYVPTFLRKNTGILSVAACALILVAITNSKYLPVPYQHKYMVGNRVLSALERMHFWIAEHTDVNAVVLVAPNNNSFSCQAKRSMPSHWQAIVHQSFFISQWYLDFAEIYGVTIDNLQGTDPRAHAVQLYQTRNYRGTSKHIDYRIDNLETCQFVAQLGPIVHQEGNWVLTEFKPK